MERKTPLRAGVVPALRTHPLGWVSVAWVGYVLTTRQICRCIRALIAAMLPLAASLLLSHCGSDLMAFFQNCTL